MVVANSPLLYDLELQFRPDSRLAQDVGSVKTELRKEMELMQDEMPGLQMMAQINSLALLKF